MEKKKMIDYLFLQGFNLFYLLQLSETELLTLFQNLTGIKVIYLN
jgi:hypothetical protein